MRRICRNVRAVLYRKQFDRAEELSCVIEWLRTTDVLAAAQTIGTHETVRCAAQQESSVAHRALLTPAIGHCAEIPFLLPYAEEWGNCEGVCYWAASVGGQM